MNPDPEIIQMRTVYRFNELETLKNFVLSEAIVSHS